MKLHDGIILVGLVLTVAGVALYSPRLAVLISGVLMVGIGVAMATAPKKSVG